MNNQQSIAEIINTGVVIIAEGKTKMQDVEVKSITRAIKKERVAFEVMIDILNGNLGNVFKGASIACMLPESEESVIGQYSELLVYSEVYELMPIDRGDGNE